MNTRYSVVAGIALAVVASFAGADDRHDMPGMEGMDMSGMDMGSDKPMAMPGMYGPYTMAREASGTSWQPDNTPLQGIHFMGETWTTMWDGYANFVYDDQGGPRGGSQGFVQSMGMFMAQRALAGGTFGVRTMVSLDPAMGKSGYPLLFQSGETADGSTTLVDRQHPHDLLMELAATYSHTLSDDSSVFIYAGLPGEPALGPPAYMHRYSGADNPETPLSHHWLDSTHITFGVVTAGVTWRTLKLEASGFNGREPDQYRWNIETRHFDSASARLSWNPAPAWSLQISHGRLASPEQLEPDVAISRTTASASYGRVFEHANWQTTLAWGRNRHSPGDTGDAWLLETNLNLHERYTLFARAESVENGELFGPGEALHGQAFDVRKLTVGGIYDFARLAHAKLGVGALVSGYDYPDVLRASYGDHPLSYLVFLRAKLD